MTDTSLVEAIRESIESPSGVLFPYRNIATGTTDTEGIRRVLIAYWGAVRQTFPEAWAQTCDEVALDARRRHPRDGSTDGSRYDTRA